MKRKKWKNVFFFCCAAMCLCTGVTKAYYSDQVSVVNEISMGDIDIALREFSVQDGREKPYVDPAEVQPGDKISKIPRITNLAAPCWIRARIQYAADTEEKEGFSDEALSGISSRWKKIGEYYYYTEVVKEKESVDLFHQLTIPKEWDGEHSEQKLSVIIQAEAIQASHFEPDFEAMSPWGNQEVERCIHEEGDRVFEKRELIRHKIEFQGEAHKLLSISDDFFSGFGAAMPGDIMRDHAMLVNTTRNPAVLYFHTESLWSNEEEMTLLKQLQLELKLNGKVLYQGALGGEELQKEIELVKLMPDERGDLEFTVSVPETLKNASALQDARVKWVFRVLEDAPSVTEKPSSTENTEIWEEESNSRLPVKTSDLSVKMVSGYMLAFTISGFVIAMFLQKGRKKE